MKKQFMMKMLCTLLVCFQLFTGSVSVFANVVFSNDDAVSSRSIGARETTGG